MERDLLRVQIARRRRPKSSVEWGICGFLDPRGKGADGVRSSDVMGRNRKREAQAAGLDARQQPHASRHTPSQNTAHSRPRQDVRYSTQSNEYNSSFSKGKKSQSTRWSSVKLAYAPSARCIEAVKRRWCAVMAEGAASPEPVTLRAFALQARLDGWSHFRQRAGGRIIRRAERNMDTHYHPHLYHYTAPCFHLQ